ncbi:hypothetical protein C8J57DRAFT_1250766 [Mycena rebaudengoi]|nr:hypothetical protein C8J57DRAFT_1250766 [Mycena rebaudengoi]
MDTSSHSLDAFAQLIALVDPPIGYSWDNLYDGSIWFKLLSQFGFQSEVVDDQLLPTLTRHARESRWKNLLSLYMQLMAHFEIKLDAPTVEFKVPLLNFIADKDTGAEPEKAIDTYTQHEQYYYLRFLYYEQSETLKEDINSSQDMLQDTQQELHLLQADLSKSNRQGTSALKLEEVYQQIEEDKKDFIKLEAEIAEHKHTIEQLEVNQTEFENRKAKLDNLQLMHNILQIKYQTTLQHLQSSENTSKAQVEELKLQRTLLDDTI